MKRLGTASLAIATLAMVFASGCTDKSQDRDVLFGIIAHTEQAARQYEYTETALGHRTQVTGAIADDLSYSAHVTIDGQTAADEVVKDDARALRVTNSDLLAKVIKPQAGGPSTAHGSAPAPAASPAPVVAAGNSGAAAAALGLAAQPLQSGLPALQAGQWVVDPTGASSLTRSTTERSGLGADPVLDSLTVLQYVTTVMNDSAGVRLFNPEDISYRAYEDPFPWPDKAAGELRYDVVPLDLPARDSIGGAPVERIQALPRANYFRHLSVYVRNGYVVAVREQISAVWRLRDTTQDILPRLADLGTNIPGNLSLRAKAAAVIAALNRFEVRAGQDPIRPRDVLFTLSNFGKASDISLPSGATTASLAGIYQRGQVLNQSATLSAEATQQ